MLVYGTYAVVYGSAAHHIPASVLVLVGLTAGYVCGCWVCVWMHRLRQYLAGCFLMVQYG